MRKKVIGVQRKMSNISALSWREHVTFDEMIMMTAFFDFYSASSLKQQPVGRHVALLTHIIPIPSQLVFALSP